jgi:hypothetical protein
MQNGDVRLAQLRQQKPQHYVEQLLAPDLTLVCYIPEPNAPWKIYLPTDILDTAVRWYHLALGHIGQNRLYDTMAIHFFHPDLRGKVENVVTKCDTCQRQKQTGRLYGEAPPREATAHPWREVAVDTIGPWTLEVGGHSIQFRALTIIDMVTNLVELKRLDNMTAAHVGLQFEKPMVNKIPTTAVLHTRSGN